MFQTLVLDVIYIYIFLYTIGFRKSPSPFYRRCLQFNSLGCHTIKSTIGRWKYSKSFVVVRGSISKVFYIAWKYFKSFGILWTSIDCVCPQMLFEKSTYTTSYIVLLLLLWYAKMITATVVSITFVKNLNWTVITRQRVIILISLGHCGLIIYTFKLFQVH